MARFCSQPGCGAVALEGRFCPSHVSDNYERHRDRHRENPLTRKWYGKAAWTRLRAWKLMQNPMCEKCGHEAATEVHHKDGSWRDGRPGAWFLFMDRANLQALCHGCHSEITAKEHLNA